MPEVISAFTWSHTLQGSQVAPTIGNVLTDTAEIVYTGNTGWNARV